MESGKQSVPVFITDFWTTFFVSILAVLRSWQALFQRHLC
jgi:hypothetical protein